MYILVHIELLEGGLLIFRRVRLINDNIQWLLTLQNIPLWQASERGDANGVKIALSNGADINSHDDRYVNPYTSVVSTTNYVNSAQ